jgi:molybdopterin/thiamine biosynthesis adenylyltransferase
MPSFTACSMASPLELSDLYTELTERNRGFLSGDAQERLRRTRLLVAGCGLGSVVAEVALRTGFEQLLLADGDHVARHNLNRQVYCQGDVGLAKTESLKRRLDAIHPGARVQSYPHMLTPATVSGIVAQADVVIDSIDLLDVQAVFALHRAARQQGKVVVSPFTLGWGAAVLVFAPEGVGLEEMTSRHGRSPASHRELFAALVECYRERIPSYVVEVFHRTMANLAEGSPCSGSQLGVATYLGAALTVSALVRLALGLAVPQAPVPIYFDPTAGF